MVRFLLGEDKYVRFLIHSTVDERFVIKEANWRLLLNGKEESSGMCDVEQKDDSWEISSLFNLLQVYSRIPK
mgnify:CR=1 FL=1|jgi:hypothetical protein